jgi:hypothetical protein
VALPRPLKVNKKALAYYNNLAFTIHAAMDNFVFLVVVETCILLIKLLHFELAGTADAGATAACVDDCTEK